MVWSSPKGRKMDETAIYELFAKQGQAIATLAIRITAMEQMLLDKGVITKAEITEKAEQLSKEFTLQTQEALRIVSEKSNNK